MANQAAEHGWAASSRCATPIRNQLGAATRNLLADIMANARFVDPLPSKQDKDKRKANVLPQVMINNSLQLEEIETDLEDLAGGHMLTPAEVKNKTNMQVVPRPVNALGNQENH